MIKCRTALLFSTGVAAMLASAPSLAAQEVAAEAPSTAASAAVTQEAAPQEGEGQTIVVTAQKREEKILEIPQSVTVVGG